MWISGSEFFHLANDFKFHPPRSMYHTFLWLSNIPLGIYFHSFYIYMLDAVHVHSSFSGYLNCFRPVMIVTSATVSNCVKTFVWISVRYIPSLEIARSYGNPIFNLLWNCSPQWLYHFIFHQRCLRVPISWIS
jgi:hypothetical protein